MCKLTVYQNQYVGFFFLLINIFQDVSFEFWIKNALYIANIKLLFLYYAFESTIKSKIQSCILKLEFKISIKVFNTSF